LVMVSRELWPWAGAGNSLPYHITTLRQAQ
jgi:hypothetical protein